MVQSSRYNDPGIANSSRCLPSSLTLPLSRTMILSASAIVLSLCAMYTLVLEPEVKLSLMVRKRACSVCVSRALVASSKNMILAFFNSTLAIASLCFSPPLIINPRSPTMVSKPCGNFLIKGASWAFSTTVITSSSVASIRPNFTFSQIVSLKSGVSCGTTPITFLKASMSYSLISLPFMRILPLSGS
ncbi:hypothetical protein AWRI1631_134400 [Saccharomyces cerevisiae AWRI1631]|uniref:Uncharacterized protein n=1 Tax=Saccharomyces cerevisiae (strain AWRI1631) TaxID=545124 RepID=B5VQ68_YEAS6|nr:hypothetical protein AWRI1631_134400 [Saccharomyces cerevisiae AWRI1631]